MGLFDSTLDQAGTTIRSSVTHVGLATGDPGAAGTANQSGAPRIAVTWGAVGTGGDFANTGDLDFTGGVASGPCPYVTLWDAPNGGNCRGSKILSGAQAFNAAGQFRIPAGSLTVAGSSTV